MEKKPMDKAELRAPVSETKTQMVAEQKPKGTVKMKLLRPCFIDDEHKLAGSIVEVSEEKAQDLEVEFEGTYSHEGYKTNRNAERNKIVRAVRV